MTKDKEVKITVLAPEKDTKGARLEITTTDGKTITIRLTQDMLETLMKNFIELSSKKP